MRIKSLLQTKGEKRSRTINNKSHSAWPSHRVRKTKATTQDATLAAAPKHLEPSFLLAQNSAPPPHPSATSHSAAAPSLQQPHIHHPSPSPAARNLSPRNAAAFTAHRRSGSHGGCCCSMPSMRRSRRRRSRPRPSPRGTSRRRAAARTSRDAEGGGEAARDREREG